MLKRVAKRKGTSLGELMRLAVEAMPEPKQKQSAKPKAALKAAPKPAGASKKKAAPAPKKPAAKSRSKR